MRPGLNWSASARFWLKTGYLGKIGFRGNCGTRCPVKLDCSIYGISRFRRILILFSGRGLSSWKGFAFGRGCRTRLRFLARILSFEKSSGFLNLVRVELFGRWLVLVEVGN